MIFYYRLISLIISKLFRTRYLLSLQINYKEKLLKCDEFTVVFQKRHRVKFSDVALNDTAL